MTEDEIRIASIKYARECWPMIMQEHGYTLDEVKTYRHFACEDFYAGMKAALGEKK